MSASGAPTVAHAFAAAATARPDAPLITFYDDASGERTELSGATLANWVAKTANLCVDGLGLTPGAVAAVRLPPHWQTAAVLLGCWVAGLTVDATGTDPADVAFVSDTPAAADEVYALALDPLGMPFRGGPPPGTADFIVEMRPYGDRLPALATIPAQVAFAPVTTHADLAGRPVATSYSRVLVDAGAHPDPADWLVGPLMAGASIVLCRHLDAARLPDRLATERATPL